MYLEDLRAMICAKLEKRIRKNIVMISTHFFLSFTGLGEDVIINVFSSLFMDINTIDNWLPLIVSSLAHFLLNENIYLSISAHNITQFFDLHISST